MSRALIVTSPSVARLPVLNSVIQAAPSCRLEVFPAVVPHNPSSDLGRIVELAVHARVDALIAVGGGSTVDAAKATSLLLQRRAHSPMAGNKPMPILAVTTTLSQAEFTDLVGITRDKAGRKDVVAHPSMMPTHVFLDGDLASHTPERVWLGTGVKALDTAIELLLHDPDKATEALLLGATYALRELLPVEKTRPFNPDLRQQQQVAAWWGAAPRRRLAAPDGSGLFSYVGAVLRHQLGSGTSAPHGPLGGILLPGALWFHSTDRVHRRDILATACGVASSDEAPEAISRLVQELGLPGRLADVGVRPDQLPNVLEAAIAEAPALAARRGDVWEVLRRAH